MVKATDAGNTHASTHHNADDIDSKYRLIIVAAQRSKQLQRGARPRVDMDPQRHKSTRIALQEVKQGKVDFDILERQIKK